MRIHSVFISLLAILGTRVYAEEKVCGTTTLSAESTPATLIVGDSILTSDTPCVYTINGLEGQFVKIEFHKSADVVEKSTCQKPFVKLEAVTGEIKTEIATLCNPTGDKTYYSPGSHMLMTIQGEKTASVKPFNVTYQSVLSVKDICGETALTANSGDSNAWTAPANELQVNQICVYMIIAKPGEVVQLTFTEIAQNPGQQGQAAAASKTLIMLENFKNGVRTPIAKISPGQQDKFVHTSAEENMIVTLFSSTGLTQKLFTAVYKSVTDPYCGPVVLQAEEDQITDWKIPLETFSSSRKCTYKIQAAGDQTVQLNITALNFGAKTKESQCIAPYLQVENFVESGNTPLENVCDTKVPRTISSTTPAMIVTLHGVEKLNKHAVTATYKAVNTCGVVPGQATEAEQFIEVYTKDDIIPQTHQCEWTITAPEDNKVDVYLKTEKDSSEKQCVDVVVTGETNSKQICRKSDNDKVTISQPVAVKYTGPGKNEFNSFKIYYKISAATEILLSFLSFLIPALLCFLQF